MSADLKIDGLNELERALKQLPGAVSKRLMSNATRSGAAVIAREARKLVPKKTGVLRKNIKVKRHRKRTKTSVAYSIGWGKDGYYGRFLELGTRYQPARPHLRPALDNNKREAIEKIRKILWRGIQRESRKYLR